MASSLLTTHDYRSRWKPRKEALQNDRKDHPTCIRFHRCMSWIARCEDETDADLALICNWIAFNSLYGQWNESCNEPMSERESWRNFLQRLINLDITGHFSQMLTGQRDLVMNLLDDEFLSDYFWDDPTDRRASQSKKSKYDARTWYVEGKWWMILNRVMERVYLLRCQLVHGAATHGGSLNRKTLQRCVEMIRHAMNAVLLTLIDHGGDEDWGLMCYPPLK